MVDIKEILVNKVNKSHWWHVKPSDSNAYEKRGKFLASTFLQAEFYGIPSDEPEKVFISNPMYGFSEIEILKKLFPQNYKKFFKVITTDDFNWYKCRINLDAKMFRKAKNMGHDCIVLMTKSGKKYLQKGIKPKSIELNLIKNY